MNPMPLPPVTEGTLAIIIIVALVVGILVGYILAAKEMQP